MTTFGGEPETADCLVHIQWYTYNKKGYTYNKKGMVQYAKNYVQQHTLPIQQTQKMQKK